MHLTPRWDPWLKIISDVRGKSKFNRRQFVGSVKEVGCRWRETTAVNNWTTERGVDRETGRKEKVNDGDAKCDSSFNADVTADISRGRKTGRCDVRETRHKRDGRDETGGTDWQKAQRADGGMERPGIWQNDRDTNTHKHKHTHTGITGDRRRYRLKVLYGWQADWFSPWQRGTAS